MSIEYALLVSVESALFVSIATPGMPGYQSSAMSLSVCNDVTFDTENSMFV